MSRGVQIGSVWEKLEGRAQLVADPSKCIYSKIAVTFELIMQLKKSLRIYNFLKVFHVVYFITVCVLFYHSFVAWL